MAIIVGDAPLDAFILDAFIMDIVGLRVISYEIVV